MEGYRPKGIKIASSKIQGIVRKHGDRFTVPSKRSKKKRRAAFCKLLSIVNRWIARCVGEVKILGSALNAREELSNRHSIQARVHRRVFSLLAFPSLGDSLSSPGGRPRSKKP